MEKRLVLFLVLSLGVLVGYSALMRMISPPAPPVVQKKKDGEEKDKQPGKEEPKHGEVEAAPKSDDPSEPAEPGETEPAEAEPPTPPATRQWASVGSYAVARGQSLLVYFNSRGATIERVEITTRDKNGDLRYNQLGKQLGYLGYLGLTPHEGGGCVVNVVGDGTPAALAGIQVGDVLMKADDTSIDRPATLDELLDAASPDDSMSLTIERPSATEPQTLPATLDVRPLELIRPEALQGEETVQHPGSYLLSLGEKADQSDISIDAPKDSDWQLKMLSDIEVEFTLPIAKSKLEVVRRFRLGQAADLDTSQPAVVPYHMSMEIELRNKADTDRQLSYTLSGPNGLPIEGWWYSAKIHKRMFYGAGARDVQCKTKGEGWWIVGCPELYKIARKEDKDKHIILFDEGNPDDEDREVEFLAVDSQFFAAVLSPQVAAGSQALFQEAKAFALGDITKQKRGRSRTTNVSFELTSEMRSIPANGAVTEKFQLFLGPKDPDILAAYKLDDVIYYGWFGGISKILKRILHFFYGIVRNYGVAILMLTIVVRGCMFPLSRKAAKNAAMMQELAPEMRKLTEKYKNEMDKRAKAQQDLFRKHNYNPFGGCWLMFLQLPIFLGLYRCIAVDIELRQAALIPGMSWCSNLAGPDQLFDWTGFMPSFFSSETSMLGPYLNVLPLITVALFVMHQKLFTPPATDEQSQMQLTMMKYMTLFMGFLFFKVASGLCLYFIASSMWGLAERLLIPKPKVNLGTGPSEPPPKKKDVDNNTAAAAEKKAARKKRNKRR